MLATIFFTNFPALVCFGIFPVLRWSYHAESKFRGNRIH